MRKYGFSLDTALILIDSYYKKIINNSDKNVLPTILRKVMFISYFYTQNISFAAYLS